MNESLYLELCRQCIQASFIVQMKFEGVVFDWDAWVFKVHLQGYEELVIHPSFFTNTNPLGALVAAFQKLPYKQTARRVD